MWRSAWVVPVLALFLSGFSQGRPEARAESSTLVQLLQQLNLDSTREGPRHWLERLGAFDSGPAHERLLAVTSNGLVVRGLDGDAAHVKLTADFDEDLRRAGARLVLVHNHPNSGGLSQDDLSHLDKAGVAAVVAVGHDGSVYAAARGPRFDSLVCGGEQYADVRDGLQKTLLREADTADVTRLLTSFSTHLAALALAKLRCLDYFSRLAPDRQASYDHDRPVFSRAVASVSARLDARRH